MNDHLERRSFLQRLLVGSGLLVAWGGLAGMLADLWMAAGRFSAAHWHGLIDRQALGADGIFPFPDKELALVVRNQSVAAISLECTHLGCLLNVVDSGFFCPCHGSEFGPQGEVYSGPATRPLPWHDVRIRNHRVWVQVEAQKAAPVWVPLNPAQEGSA